jgi:hypothetical protein
VKRLRVFFCWGSDIDWVPVDELLACACFCASTSCLSSLVSNREHVRSQKFLMRRPYSIVSHFRWSSVAWVCILSLARPCYSAVRYNNVMMYLLSSIPRRPSNAGMEHWSDGGCQKQQGCSTAMGLCRMERQWYKGKIAWVRGGKIARWQCSGRGVMGTGPSAKAQWCGRLRWQNSNARVRCGMATMCPSERGWQEGAWW